jgi:hypothetical protein
MNVEENLTAVLRERADREVDAGALLAGALAAGRARRRRNQRTVALAGAGVAGVTAATVLAVPLGLRGGGDGLTADGTVMGEPMPALPAAAGEPGLAERPDLVGADPNVLRFAVPWAPMPTVGVNWRSVEGTEQVDLNLISPQSNDDRTIWLSATITAARGSIGAPQSDRPETRNTTTAVTINGRPGEIEHEPANSGASWLTWQAADGVQMQISPGAAALSVAVAAGSSADAGIAPDDLLRLTDEDLVRLAESIRLDGTTRCTAPIRLTSLPDDAHLVGCSSGMFFGRPDGGTSYDTELRFKDPAGSQLSVWSTSPAFPSPGPSNGSDPSVFYAPDLGSKPSATYYPSAPGSTDPSAYTDPSPYSDPSSGADPSGVPSGEPVVPTQSFMFDRPGLVGTVSTAGDYGQADAEAVIDGVEVIGDVADPTTWPARPVG